MAPKEIIVNITTRHLAAVGILTATAFAATGCGSSDDAGTAATTPTTVVTGDPAIDNAIDTSAAEAALVAMDDQSANLPDDSKSAYDQLKADLESAKTATGNEATDAWAKVKADVTTIDDQLANANTNVDSTTKNAWTDVKNEFDKITANF
jgi:hypothetical protein